MSNQKVGVYLELKNSEGRGLGLPLPKGRMRVYKADASGSQQLIGEDWIDHTPRDEKIKIKMGDAFDVPGDWEVLRATHPHEKVQAFTAKWNLPVPKDGETKLTYRVRVRW